VNVQGAGGASASNDSHAYGFGAPGYANGPFTCQAGIPIIGGTYTITWCQILVEAAAVKDDAVQKEVLCNLERIRAAYAVTGRPCKSAPQ
jgi:hypothetical protein